MKPMMKTRMKTTQALRAMRAYERQILVKESEKAKSNSSPSKSQLGKASQSHPKPSKSNPAKAKPNPSKILKASEPKNQAQPTRTGSGMLRYLVPILPVAPPRGGPVRGPHVEGGGMKP